jgi:hypothetical protein
MKKIGACLIVMLVTLVLGCLWFWLTEGNPFLHFQETLLIATVIGLLSMAGGTLTKWY